MLLCCTFGRYETLRNDVVGATAAGTAAAAVAPDANQAEMAATTAAAAEIAGSMCRDPEVHTDTGHFEPGGTVAVTVTCTLVLSDLGLPGVPGSTVVSVTHHAPIDPYRVAG
jgi:hypothetical protein